MKAKLHKKPKLEHYVKPEEKALFAEPPRPLPSQKVEPIPKIKKRPVVNHDVFFGDLEVKKGIPKYEKKPDLSPPSMSPMIEPPKQGFFDKIKRFFKKKA